jgi:hypothetical protein
VSALLAAAGCADLDAFRAASSAENSEHLRTNDAAVAHGSRRTSFVVGDELFWATIG